MDPNRPFLGLESHARLERVRSIQELEDQEKEEILEEDEDLFLIYSQGKYYIKYIYIFIINIL